MKNQHKIWITWEQHRRSSELAKRLDASLFTILPHKNYFLKVLTSSLKTMWILIQQRPDILFVQNPSILLNLLACWLKPVFRYTLIADRHTNFRFETENSKKNIERVYHKISRYVVKHSDVTIVTNVYLKELIDSWGGDGFILPDALPDLPLSNSGAYKLSHDKKNIVFICTYADDEPIEEVKKACELNPDINFYITGRPNKKSPSSWPKNVIATGFLKEEEYQSLLNESDIILVLTTEEHLLLCGAYEAITLGKPLVLSDTEALKYYFSKGTVYCDNTPNGISEALREAMQNYDKVKSDMLEFQAFIDKDWDKKFKKLLDKVI